MIWSNEHPEPMMNEFTEYMEAQREYFNSKYGSKVNELKIEDFDVECTSFRKSYYGDRQYSK